jgi:hypothetical protein
MGRSEVGSTLPEHTLQSVLPPGSHLHETDSILDAPPLMRRKGVGAADVSRLRINGVFLERAR